MRVTAIIQARMGSTRLPGKVLADIGGRSMLSRVCRRVGRARRVDRLLVATTDQPEDQPIVDECKRLAVGCFRGSEQDVLDRYYHAAKAWDADPLVRITADCPLIDPRVIDQVVEAFLQARPDYASNTLKRTWPRGLDTEVVGAPALARAWREAAQPYQRTHVTPYIYENAERFRLLAVTHHQRFGGDRWTVDLPEDLKFVRAVCRRLGEQFSWQDVRRLLAREPGLLKLNGHVRQKEIKEA